MYQRLTNMVRSSIMDRNKKIRIKNIIKEIFVLAQGKEDWFLIPSIAMRLNWIKNLEYYD